uniref:Fe-hydrogenase-like protein n=1 Tax=Holomastigotoides mirabile TaxID=104086 RepID=A8J6C0_9EUKA|nr:Fe-hydrogenase-like protein [Holomastigotoides mirabile]
MLPLSGRFAAPLVDTSTNSIALTVAKCVGCGQCVKACSTVAGQGVLKLIPDGKKKKVTTVLGVPLQETNCIKCGQCTLVCGPSAIMEKDETGVLESVIANPQGKTIVCQVAPAIRINVCDALGLPAGSIEPGKLVSALKLIGFDKVFDTNWSADLTIVEEASELVHRIQSKGVLPMFTSCCPAWVNEVEQSQPDLIPHLSTARSPLGMLGAVIKSDWAKLSGTDPRAIYSVAIMPCTAKKDEVAREQFATKGYRETDLVITTRELVKLIKKKGINFKSLPDTPFDDCYSEAAGAGAIFCASGGVMEAAVRSAYYYLLGKELAPVEVQAVRGLEGIKVGEVDLAGLKVKIAVAQGIANAKKMIREIKSGDLQDVVFAEVMACPGGCVCGGGSTRAKTKAVLDARVAATYKIDATSQIRQSHANPQIVEYYKRFAGTPGICTLTSIRWK